MEQNRIPLGNYVDGQIYRGIVTGFNKAFVIDGNTRAELIKQDKKSEEIIKPLAVGDDVRKWHIRERGQYLLISSNGRKNLKLDGIRVTTGGNCERATIMIFSINQKLCIQKLRKSPDLRWITKEFMQ